MRTVHETSGAPAPTFVTRTTAEGQGSPEPVVRVRNLSTRVRRDDGTVATVLDDVSLDVDAGQMLVLVGPHGAGHVTLLRSIAGLESPDAGIVEVGGASCFDAGRGHDVAPAERPVGLVPRGLPLPPDRTALEAVAGSRRAGAPGGDDARARAGEMLGRLDVTAVADRHPHELTGRDRLRVVLARALVGGIEVVLLDEPLVGLDARLRRALGADLVGLQRELGFTAVVVTHDQAAATPLAERLAVMEGGRIAQIGDPGELYGAPRSRTVAVLTGTTNELRGELAAVGPRSSAARVRTPLGEVTGRSGGGGPVIGGPVVALWRPEQMRLGLDEPDVANRWPVTVEASLYLGADTQHVVVVDGLRFLIWQPAAPDGADWFPRQGEAGWVHVDPADVRVLPVSG